MLGYRRTMLVLGLLLAAGALACNMDLGIGQASKPVVEILSPPSGSRVELGEEVAVLFRAVDEVGVSRVELEADGLVVAVERSDQAEGQPSMTATLPWTPTAPGSYTLLVYAYNRDGVVSDAVGVSVVVASPAATFTVPAPTPTETQVPPTAQPATPTDTVAPVAVTPGVTQPPLVTPPPPTPRTDTARIVLTNNSGFTVSFVGIVPGGATSWGDNRLPNPLPSGSSYTFQVAPGVWDLAAVDTSERMISQRREVTVSGTFNWTIQRLSANLVLHNNSGVQVRSVYFTLSTEASWGEDRLYKHTVPNGGTYTWPVFPGTYDLRARGPDGSILDERRGVSITGTYDWRVTGAGGTTVSCPGLRITLGPAQTRPYQTFGIQFERPGAIPAGYDYVVEFSADSASWNRTQPVPAKVRQDGAYWMAETSGPGEGTFYWRVCLVNMANPAGPAVCCTEPPHKIIHAR